MTLVKTPKTVYVGLSGGVDSSVTAFLLKEAGYNVKAVYLKRIGKKINEECPFKEDIEFGEKTAKFLGIDYEIWDKTEEYKKLVLDYFIKETQAGRTPNPDVLCNNLFKFGVFLKEAVKHGADFVATGHYAVIGGKTGAWRFGDSVALYTGLDRFKDQSYFLHRLSRSQLKRALMPIGWLYKKEVRAIASYIGLPSAKRKDSQGICFLGDIDINDFLMEYIKPKEGPIVDIETGKVVGKHKGVWFYTVGQRSGLGIGGLKTPYYVVFKDAVGNILYVAQSRENKFLYRKCLTLNNIYLINKQIKDNDTGFNTYAVIRYHGQASKSYVDLEKLTVCSKGKGFWAPAVGQFAVFYEKDPKFKSVSKDVVTYQDDPKTLVKVMTTSIGFRGFVKERAKYLVKAEGGAAIAAPPSAPNPQTTLAELLHIPQFFEELTNLGIPCLSCPLMGAEQNYLTIEAISNTYGLDMYRILSKLIQKML